MKKKPTPPAPIRYWLTSIEPTESLAVVKLIINIVRRLGFRVEVEVNGSTLAFYAVKP